MFKALIATLIVSIAVLYFTGIAAAITVFLVMGVVTYKGVN